jgi:hypothetical protein
MASKPSQTLHKRDARSETPKPRGLHKGKKRKKGQSPAARGRSPGPKYRCSKSGVAFQEGQKHFLATVLANLEQMRATRQRGATLREEFFKLTGVQYSTVKKHQSPKPKKQKTEPAPAPAPVSESPEEYTFEQFLADAPDDFIAEEPPAEEPQNNMGPPKKRGPTPKDPCKDIENFFEYVADKVERKKKKGWLTLQMLREDIQKEHGLVLSKKVLRRTLKRLGFSYQKRKGVWTSRRAEPQVQDNLRKFLEWVVLNSEKVTVTDPNTGETNEEYKWTSPVAFFDETYLWTIAYRDWSWCLTKDPTKEKIPVDEETKKRCASDHRACVLHTLFSHLETERTVTAMDPYKKKDLGKRPASFKTWIETWTGKVHEFTGPCTGETVLQYSEKHIAPDLGPGGTLVCDNAGQHKEFVQKMEDWTCDKIEDFITEREGKTGQKLFNAYMATPKVQGATSERKRRKALMDWVRERSHSADFCALQS